ncbi:MAG TPA: hypothetical protein VFT50_18280 [Baekduia sp.]|nr:hypothetical protein [Baekduia sp.]
MSHKIRRALFAVAMLAISLVGVASASATTVSPSGSGNVYTATNSGSTVFKDSAGTSISCTSSTLTGTTSSSGAFTFSSESFGGTCSGAGFNWTVSTSGTWTGSVTYDAGGNHKFQITVPTAGAHLSNGFGCTFDVQGTTSAWNGTSGGKYVNSGTATLTNASGLSVSNVAFGCFGAVASGPGATFSGTYTLNPTATVSS